MNRFFLQIIISFFLSQFCYKSANAQKKQPMIRLAKIIVDSAQLESYKNLGREEIETSLRIEPGVLTLYAVSEKNDPTHITILEIYADSNAYKKHLKTAHFLKYKNGTIKMVKSLELINADPLIPDAKLIEIIKQKNNR